MAGTVLGLPVASWIGPEFGWRASFWVVAAVALVVGVITAGAVPKLEGDGTTSVRGEFAVFKNWKLWAVYSTSTLVIGSTYAAFSYFTPILSEVTGFSGGWVTGLLVACGVATIVGNTVVGRLADRHAIPTIAFGLVSLMVLLSLFALLTENKPVVVAVLLGVGLVGVTMNPALVARVMSPEDLDALWKPHQECVAERSGVPVSGSGSEGGGTGMRAATPEEVRADEAAQEACVDRQPLPPWEKDPANPEAHDFAVRVVDCLRGKGVKHVEVAVDETLGGPVISLGGEHNDSASISAGLEHVRSCETEASKK